MPRRFEFGQLTHGNVDAVAKRMIDMFRGKYFSVASIVMRKWTERIDLETDNVLRAEWTDGRGARPRPSEEARRV
jgi:hypothetical protein